MMRAHLITANGGHDKSRKYFGSSPLIILVRPDGYAAFTGSDNSSAQLANFCEKWLVPKTSSAKAENAHA
jgi:hypothetical protein